MDDGGMTGGPQGDERWTRLVADALALDVPPANLVAIAKESFVWRSIDVELAELTFDSLHDGALAGVRGTAVARSLSFEVADVVIDVEATEHDATVDLLGQVSPDGATSLHLERPDGGRTALAIDGLGRFRVAGLPGGPARFVLARGATAPVCTDWVIL